MRGIKKIILAVAGLATLVTLSGCAKSEDKLLSSMIGRISYAARKYNKNITRNGIASAAGLGLNCSPTEQNFYKATYYAFKAKLPKATKTRKYVGYNSYKEFSKENLDSVPNYISFFAERGLLDPNDYIEGNTIDPLQQSNFLQLIHTYMGSSLVDDFATTVNRDYLYGNKFKDSSYYGTNTSAEVIYSGTSGDADGVPDKMTTDFVNGVKDDDTYISKINCLYNYADYYDFTNVGKEGTLQYELYCDLTSMKTADDFYNYEKKLLDLSGTNDFIIDWRYKDEPELDMKIYTNDFIYRSFVLSSDYENDEDNLDVIRDWYIVSLNNVSNLFELPEGSVDQMIEDIAVLTKNGKEILDNLPAKYTNVYENWEYSYQRDDPLLDAGMSHSFYDMLYSLCGEFTKKAFAENPQVIQCAYFISKAAMNPENIKGIAAVALAGLAAYHGHELSYSKNYFEYRNYKALVNHVLYAYLEDTDYYKESVSAIDTLYNDSIVKTFEKSFDNCSYLTSADKEVLKDKLNSIETLFFLNDNGVDIDFSYVRETDYSKGALPIAMAASRWELDMKFNALNNSGTTKELIFFDFDAFTVNACYYQLYNKLYLIDGFLFTSDFPHNLSIEELLVNYGFVLAHEISHGFDPEGIKISKDGVTDKYIVSSQAIPKYGEKVAKIKNMYYLAPIVPGIYTDCDAIWDEAVADQMALGIIMDIAKQQPNFNYDKFFKLFAKRYLTVYNRVTYEALAKISEPHPAGAVRVNKLLANCPEFVELYGIQSGDAMYLEPSKRIRIWE